ncbi:MAG TPA: hypothetical protein VER33_23920, partial [Polyangiaceae bacterium]|nr:hypothetical protein [Polyangiaceae bacterium]
PHRDLSKDVLRVHDVRCPASKIRAVSRRSVGAENLYVLDACGVAVEVEEGTQRDGRTSVLVPARFSASCCLSRRSPAWAISSRQTR